MVALCSCVCALQGFEMMDAMSGYPSPASSLLDKLREQEQQEQATAHASSSGAVPDTRSHDHDQQQQRRPGEGWRSRCGLLPAPPASSSTRLRQQSRRSRFRGSSSSSNSLSPPSQSQASSYAPCKPLYRYNRNSLHLSRQAAHLHPAPSIHPLQPSHRECTGLLIAVGGGSGAARATGRPRAEHSAERSPTTSSSSSSSLKRHG